MGNAAASTIRLEIEAPVAEFAWRIDHKSGHGVADLFTEDGVYEMGPESLRGRADPEEFDRRRREEGPRTSRRIFTNLRLWDVESASARGTCVLSLHAANGTPSYPLSPLIVADYDDEYVLFGGFVFRGTTASSVSGH